MTERTFKYKGVRGRGEVADLVRAETRQDALLRLAQDGVVVTEIEEQTSQSRVMRERRIDTALRILILRQLALMASAGVDLLESLDSTAAGVGGQAADQLRQTALALRRGEKVSEAFRVNMPNYPTYVYTLISVGEASGQLGRVLDDAAEQLAFEDRIRREVLSALTYPTFLVLAGGAAVGFLFYEVVPRFAEMIGDNRANLTGLAAFVIGAGETFRANAVLFLAAIAGLVLMIASTASSPSGRQRIYDAALKTPVLNNMLMARERVSWSRIMCFALRSGVGLLDAADLASASAPEGRFRRGLTNASRQIRAGKRLEEAFAEPGLFTSLDLSLLRTGQRTGALAEMFQFMADRYEQDLQEGLKRATRLIEPIAIGIVALAVGAVAIGLVTAMSSVYDTVM